MKRWTEAISACVANADRILDDAKYLEEWGRFPSARALGILAQEEFAKAYLLKLVDEAAIPMCDEVLRACRDHTCKHLIGLVMAHLFTPIEEWPSRDAQVRDRRADLVLPAHVADALNIFCHEKLRRWRSQNWGWVEEPSYDQKAKKIADGSLDRVKQNALYVGVGRDGLTSTPHCTPPEAREAIETAEMLKDVAKGYDVFAFTEKAVVTTGLRAILHELRTDKG
jgi:AbiV family abortive infection protein